VTALCDEQIVLRGHAYTLFFFYKNVVFPAQAEYSYFSADFRLKIFLYSWVARDVIIFENPKLESHERYYLHQA